MSIRLQRNFNLLLIAKFLSEFAGYIFDIGIVIYLYQVTDSMYVISGFFLSQLLPAFLTIFAGKYIDRLRKNRILSYSNLIKIILFASFIYYKNPMWILAVNFILNVITTVEMNTCNAIMTDIFSEDKILKAGTILSFLSAVSMIIAPILSALIVDMYSLNMNIFICIVLYAVAVVSYLFMKVANDSNKEDTIINEHPVNFKVLTPPLVKITFFWCLFMFCIGMTAPLEISMIQDCLQMDSKYYGIGNTVEGLGMLLASGVLLKIIKKFQAKHIVAMGLFSAALSYFVIAVSPNIWVYYAGAILVGMTAVLCPLGFKSSIQIIGDKNSMGQIFSISRFMVLIARAIGTAGIGILVLHVPIRAIYIFIAMMLAVFFGLFLKWESTPQ